jgi:class I fructose-bisphosphate aldolase
MATSSQLFTSTGKKIRLGRILNPSDQRAAVVAFDHGLHVGMIPGVEHPGEMLETLAEAGADAFLVSPGIANTYSSVFTGHGAPGLILRVDWSNRWRSQGALGFAEGRTRMIASVEDAARLGADAVLAYLFIGYEDAQAEVDQAEAVAHMVRVCDTLGIGCIVEPMARGKQADHDFLCPDYIALGVRIACELGADLLKTDYSGSAETFRQATHAAFRPILIAGGPKTPTMRAPLEMVRGALDAGASGMFIGRNVFQADDPGKTMRVLRRVIHEDLSVEAALALLAE